MRQLKREQLFMKSILKCFCIPIQRSSCSNSSDSSFHSS